MTRELLRTPSHNARRSSRQRSFPVTKQRTASLLNRWTLNKYQDDPAIAKWLVEYGSIWKQLDPVVADAYAGFQRKINDRNKPEAKKYRALLADAFNQAVELRGGGSASVQFYTFALAHEEWIIAHFGTKSDYVPDEKFASQLTKDLTVGASPEGHQVQSVLAKLKAVERFLNQDDAAFLRAEFLSYFES